MIKSINHYFLKLSKTKFTTYKSIFIRCQYGNVLTVYLKLNYWNTREIVILFLHCFIFIDINTALFGILFKNLKNIIQRSSLVVLIAVNKYQNNSINELQFVV